MGMDIHTVLQVRTNGQWESIDPPADMLDEYRDPPWELRNYSWFGLLAGMRDRCVDLPIAEGRGVPDDAGAVWTGAGWWGELPTATIEGRDLGEYGYSWVALPELQAVDLSVPYSGRYGGGTLADHVSLDWVSRLAQLAADPADVRLVFGFDG